MATKLTFLTCLGSTLFMTGLIWFVQAVHYPLFDRVDPGSFGRYHAEHVRRAERLVPIPMLLELISSLALVMRRPAGIGPALAWAGLATASATWLSTALLQVPHHDRRAAGFDAPAHRALVATNWLRTTCWSLHAAIVLSMAARLIS